VLKRFILAFVAFVGLIVPATFALALLAPRCNRTLADATGGVAAMQARIKSLGASAGPEICTATRLYFLEVVKARGHCTV
jgi:hypothetical protein